MDFQKYKSFTPVDYATDEQFWKWVIGQNGEFESVWQELFAALPEKKEEILEAKSRIEMLCEMGMFPDF